jgi:transposase-like protein
MRASSERSELIRAVKKHGEAVSRVAARLGVPTSTAYRWMRFAGVESGPVTKPKPTFVELVAEPSERSTILVRVGVAEIEVRAGFDTRLLREVAEALGGET